MYLDSTWDIRSNIPLCLWEFPPALPLKTPLGEGVYLTVYPSSHPNMDTVYPKKVFNFKDHYEKYIPRLKVFKDINFSILLLRMIYCTVKYSN